MMRALSFIDHYLDGGPWAVGGQASIGGSAIVPVLNVVALVGMVYQQPDLLTRYPRIASYWSAARDEPVNARVISEPNGGGAEALTASCGPATAPVSTGASAPPSH